MKHNQSPAILVAAAAILAGCAQSSSDEMPSKAPQMAFVGTFAISLPTATTPPASTSTTPPATTTPPTLPTPTQSTTPPSTTSTTPPATTTLPTRTTIAPAADRYSIFWEATDTIDVSYSGDGYSASYRFAVRKNTLSADRSQAVFVAADGSLPADFFDAGTRHKARFGALRSTMTATTGNASHLPMEAPETADRTFSFEASTAVLAISIPDGVTADRIVVKTRGASPAVVRTVACDKAADVFYIPIEAGSNLQYEFEAYDGTELIAESMKMQTAATMGRGQVFPFEFTPTREVSSFGEYTLDPYPATYAVRIKSDIATTLTIAAPASGYPARICVSARNYAGGDDFAAETLVVDAPETHVDLEHGSASRVTSRTASGTLTVRPTFCIDTLTTERGGISVEGAGDGRKNVKVVVVANTAANRAGVGITVASQTSSVKADAVEIVDNLTGEHTPISVTGTLFKDNQPGNYYVSSGDAVACIGTSRYPSLAAALAAVPSNGTAVITVLKDNKFVFQDQTFATIGEGQDVTIDLNGKKVVSASSCSGASRALLCNGTLTIRDGIGGGSWTHGASVAWVSDGTGSRGGNYDSDFIINYGTLTLADATFENVSSGSPAYLVDAYGSGTVTIEDGSYAACEEAFRLSYGSTQMTVEGGSVTSASYNITQRTGVGTTSRLEIKGGVFTTDSESTFNVYLCAEESGNEATAGVNGSGNEATAGVNESGNGATAKVSGGVFNAYGVGIDSDFNQSGVSVEGGKFYGVWNYGSGKFVSGGLYTKSPDKYVRAGYEVRDNEDAATSDQYPYAVVKQ